MNIDEIVNGDDHELRRCEACNRAAVRDAALIWRLRGHRDAAELVHVAMEALLAGVTDDAVAGLAALTGEESVRRIATLAEAGAGDENATAAHARRYLGGRVRAADLMAAEVFLGDVLDDDPAASSDLLALWDSFATPTDDLLPAVRAAAEAALRARCPASVCAY